MFDETKYNETVFSTKYKFFIMCVVTKESGVVWRFELFCRLAHNVNTDHSPNSFF